MEPLSIQMFWNHAGAVFKIQIDGLPNDISRSKTTKNNIFRNWTEKRVNFCPFFPKLCVLEPTVQKWMVSQETIDPMPTESLIYAWMKSEYKKIFRMLKVKWSIILLLNEKICQFKPLRDFKSGLTLFSLGYFPCNFA